MNLYHTPLNILIYSFYVLMLMPRTRTRVCVRERERTHRGRNEHLWFVMSPHVTDRQTTKTWDGWT